MYPGVRDESQSREARRSGRAVDLAVWLDPAGGLFCSVELAALLRAQPLHSGQAEYSFTLLKGVSPTASSVVYHCPFCDGTKRRSLLRSVVQWQKRAVGGLAAGSGGDPHWCVAGAGAPQAREQGICPFLKEYILLPC